MRHICRQQGAGGRGWHTCTACDGRIHLEGCTTKKNKHRDCCPERHKMLFDAGEVYGLIDGSHVMWAEDYPHGYHPYDLPVSDPRSTRNKGGYPSLPSHPQQNKRVRDDD